LIELSGVRKLMDMDAKKVTLSSDRAPATFAHRNRWQPPAPQFGDSGGDCTLNLQQVVLRNFPSFLFFNKSIGR